MATAELRLVHVDEVPTEGQERSDGERLPLHRIREVREQQHVSLRSAARRMRTDMATVRAEEDENADLRLSELYRWQQALDVPVADLLEDTGSPLSRPVMERARMVRLMKTAMAILEQSDASVSRMAQNLVDQLIEVMPELADVAAWHAVGQRRGLNELGRIAECPISDEYLGNPTSNGDW